MIADDLANMTISSSAPLVNDQITWQSTNKETRQRKSLIPLATKTTTYAKDAEKMSASSKPLLNVIRNHDDESAEDIYTPKNMYVLYYEE